MPLLVRFVHSRRNAAQCPLCPFAAASETGAVISVETVTHPLGQLAPAARESWQFEDASAAWDRKIASLKKTLEHDWPKLAQCVHDIAILVLDFLQANDVESERGALFTSVHGLRPPTHSGKRYCFVHELQPFWYHGNLIRALRITG